MEWFDKPVVLLLSGVIPSMIPANLRPQSGKIPTTELGSWLILSGGILISGVVNLVGL